MVLFTGRHYSWPNHRMGVARSQVHHVTSSHFLFRCPSLPPFLASVALFAVIFPLSISTVTSTAVCLPWSCHSSRDFYGSCPGQLFLCAGVTAGQLLSALHLWVSSVILPVLDKVWKLVDPVCPNTSHSSQSLPLPAGIGPSDPRLVWKSEIHR